MFHSNHQPISHLSEINGNKIAYFSHPRVLNALDEGVPLGIWYRHKGPECFYDVATRWSKKFQDRFCHFETILAVTDTQPASHVAIASMDSMDMHISIAPKNHGKINR